MKTELIDAVNDTMKDMMEELTTTHEDERYVRNTVTMLVHSDAAYEVAIESLKKRVERVERKVGITK
jgi:chaperonin cofactor prefoldin